MITGGSGLIGSRLTQKLIANNYEVVHLTRSKNSKHDVKTYEWNWGKNEIDENCLENIKVIVHLAGAGIAEKPWTQKRKETIVKSRVLTTRLLHEVIQKHKIKLSSFISASGIGVMVQSPMKQSTVNMMKLIMILLEIVVNNGKEQQTYFKMILTYINLDWELFLIKMKVHYQK